MRCFRYMKFDRAEQSLNTQFFKVSRLSGPRVDKAKAAKLVCDLRKSSEYSHVHFFETMFDDVKYAYQYKRVA